MDYQYGDKVVFTDEFGKEQVGTVNNTKTWDTEGLLSTDTGSYGVYTRKPEEVRLAQDYEVHQADIKRLRLGQ